MRVVVAKDLGQDPVSKGVYKATVTKNTVKKSKAGNQLIWFTYTLNSQGPNPDEKTIGRKVTDNITLMESTMFRANALHKAATGKDIKAGEYDDEQLAGILVAACMNKELMITVDVGTYEGQPRNTIASFNAIKAG